MSNKEMYERKTEEYLQPIVDEYGFELVDVEYVKEAGEYYLRAYIDKENGIDINDCEKVSRRMNEILDKEDYIKDSYIFEVSSPGLTRPLKKDKDFERNIGKDVELKLYKAVDGYKEYVGVLKEYDENMLKIAISENEILTFERKNIALIRLYIDF